MKRALVLGGTQFFGKRLVQNLLESGWDVTIATRGKTPDPFGDKVRRLVVDRTERSTLESAFGQSPTDWDCVFDQTCYAPIEVQDVTEILTGRIGHYVFTSTMAVYDFGTAHQENSYDPYTYPLQIGSRHDYAGLKGYREAKRQAEAFLFQASSIPTTAVRFPLVIGPDDYTGRLKFHVERVKAEKPIGISRLQDRIGFITSNDAARFLQFAAEGKLLGPYNAGSPGDLSFQELMERISIATGTKARVIAPTEGDSRSPYDVGGSLSIDVSKATAAGFAFSEIDDVLGELILYYLHTLSPAE
jgi:nucleoside-diphosphate-sugar epimerase